MSARRAVIIVFSVFLGITCMWVPWRAPGYYSTPSDEFDLRPDPGGAMVNLGYGWVWSGPRALQGTVSAQSPEMLASEDNIGRSQAKRNALEAGLPPPSENELSVAGWGEQNKWALRISLPSTYYRNHATPDYLRILLVAAAGAALAGVLYGLLSRRRAND